MILPPHMRFEAGDGAYVSAEPHAGFTERKPRLTALLFRGLRFTPSKAHKNTTCYNCAGRMKKGSPTFRGNGAKIRHLHPACAEDIAVMGNEHTRETIE